MPPSIRISSASNRKISPETLPFPLSPVRLLTKRLVIIISDAPLEVKPAIGYTRYMSNELHTFMEALQTLEEHAGPAWEILPGSPAQRETTFTLRKHLGEDCMRKAGYLLVDSIVNREITSPFVCDFQRLETDLSLFSFSVRAQEPVDIRLADALRASTPENCL